jgi:hypothetical protein
MMPRGGPGTWILDPTTVFSEQHDGGSEMWRFLTTAVVVLVVLAAGGQAEVVLKTSGEVQKDDP